jgi:hypothetical protein
MWGIYGMALILISPVSILVWSVNRVIGEPASWSVVLCGGAAMAACYYSLVLWRGIEPQHRTMMLASLKAGARNLY